MPEYEFVKYESLEEGRIVRILLNRPGTRNAQNRGMLVELDDAFRTAEKDDEVRVVILGGVGPLFSSGHDMGSKLSQSERETHPSFKGDGATRKGAESLMLQEWHYYFSNTLRAKELLLTSDAIDVEEAHRLGMVSKIFPTEALEERTLDYARRMAELPTVTALLIKESVNQTVDNMGFYNSLKACFTLHELNHAHWAEIHENRYPAALAEDGIADWRTAAPVKVSVPDAVEGPVPAR